MAYQEHVQRITDAIDAERRIEGWRRAKEALIRVDREGVQRLAKRPSARAKLNG